MWPLVTLAKAGRDRGVSSFSFFMTSKPTQASEFLYRRGQSTNHMWPVVRRSSKEFLTRVNMVSEAECGYTGYHRHATSHWYLGEFRIKKGYFKFSWHFHSANVMWFVKLLVGRSNNFVFDDRIFLLLGTVVIIDLLIQMRPSTVYLSTIQIKVTMKRILVPVAFKSLGT